MLDSRLRRMCCGAHHSEEFLAMIGSHSNVAHVDEGALDWAIRKWKVESFLDIGCGLGKMVDLAAKRGLIAWGVDGDEKQSREGILVHDFCLGPFDPAMSSDLGWSTEFVEHVEERYVFHFMPLFRHCSRVIMTHALPPNSPPSHVNCKSEEYWITTFRQWGFEWASEASSELRAVSSMSREFVRNTGKVFVR